MFIYLLQTVFLPEDVVLRFVFLIGERTSVRRHDTREPGVTSAIELQRRVSRDERAMIFSLLSYERNAYSSEPRFMIRVNLP